MSQQTQMESRKKRRKRSKRLTSSRYKIRVRYKYHYYRWINTKDYGSYKDIYEKYKDKGYTWWCADLPPEFSNQDGTWTGYRLDGDKTHTASLLTSDPLAFSILNASAFIGFAVFALFIGVYVDRHRRQRIMTLANVGRGIFLGLIPLAAVTGTLTRAGMPLLYFVSFMVGLLTV